MARNVGPEDRVVRIVVALGLGVLIYMGVLGSIASIIAGVIAAYLLITGLLARCVFYKLIDVDTAIQEQPYSSTDDRGGLEGPPPKSTRWRERRGRAVRSRKLPAGAAIGSDRRQRFIVLSSIVAAKRRLSDTVPRRPRRRRKRQPPLEDLSDPLAVVQDVADRAVVASLGLLHCRPVGRRENMLFLDRPIRPPSPSLSTR